MTFSYTFSKYIARLFIMWFFSVLLTLASIVCIFDYIELLRRARGRPDITLGTISQMVFLQLPGLITELMPFIILFAVMMVFWRLGKGVELAVARSAGMSIWQLIAPIIFLIGFYSFLDFTLFNPLSATMMGRFEQLNSRYFKGYKNNFMISDTGLWLKTQDNTSYSIVRVMRVSSTLKTLENVTIYKFSPDDQFLIRYDADMVELYDGFWRLKNALISKPHYLPQEEASLDLETDLVFSKLQYSFVSPDTLSFWALPEFISLLEKSGLSSVSQRLYWHKILARPFLFFAMAILAAIVAFRISLRQGLMGYCFIAIGFAFCLYILHSIAIALGLSLIIPVVVAAWAPTCISMFSVLAFLLHLEDA